MYLFIIIYTFFLSIYTKKLKNMLCKIIKQTNHAKKSLIILTKES